MNRYSGLVLAFAFAAIAPRAGAQSAGQADAIAQLRSADWETRAKAFDALNSQPGIWQTRAMADALQQLFTREDRLISQSLRESGGKTGISERYGEGFGMHYSAVFDACLEYCERGAFLSVLLADAARGSPVRGHTVELLGMNVTRFNGTQRAMIADALAQATEDTSERIRDSALRGIGEAVRRDPQLSGAPRATLHRAVMAAIQDRRLPVRLTAVRRLADFGAPEDLALLSRLASQDSTPSVRDEAKRTLTRLGTPSRRP